jgi:hypothetical protein
MKNRGKGRKGDPNEQRTKENRYLQERSLLKNDIVQKKYKHKRDLRN